VGVTDHLARATRYLLGNLEVRSEVVLGQDASVRWHESSVLISEGGSRSYSGSREENFDCTMMLDAKKGLLETSQIAL
jgi:hypothetical protein